MKILIAPQALKGSLDAKSVGGAIAFGVRSVYAEAEVLVVPVADGGEGTVHALVAATSGRLVETSVQGPLGDRVNAEWGILGQSETGERTAVIEMAAASGLPLVAEARRNPRLTSTYGTGELIRAALDAGCQSLLIGIGGSATNDGGAGMASALGARFLDLDGRELAAGGAELARLAHIDTSGLDARLARTSVQVACDVTNPLFGPEGASVVYGPQKGATAEMVQELDSALRRYSSVLQNDLGVDVATVAGSGAAGGLGAGLMAFTHATLVPGAQLVLDALHLAEKLAGTDLVLTAEGRLDAQTAYGKAVAAVAALARQHRAPVVALAGSVTAGQMELEALGINAALAICDGPLTLEESMACAAPLLESAAACAMRIIAIGRGMSQLTGASTV
jgi:glycerate kinase